MTGNRGDEVRRADARRRGVSTGVLADRMAATLVHHEPGWRLPRLTALARRYNVSAAEIDSAIDELAARHLLRRLPDGQVYRASPAEYYVPLEGLSGLVSHVDPMGGQLVCKSRHVSRRRPPEDIGRSLGLAPGDPVVSIRCIWTVGGEPAALSASYLPERMGHEGPDLGAPPFSPLVAGSPADAAPAGMAPADVLPDADAAPVRPASGAPPVDAPPVDALPVDALPVDALPVDALPVDALPVDGGAPVRGALAGTPLASPRGGVDEGDPVSGDPWGGRGGLAGPGAASARALQIELAPPPPSVARSLHLAVGELVVTVTVSFEDPAAHHPVALTTTMLRPDLFRVVIQATAAPAPDGGTDGLASTWTHSAQGWEP
jgi:UTRA domain/Bacterial regulatory proteins, gntR family